jgi:ribosomal protein S2
MRTSQTIIRYQNLQEELFCAKTYFGELKSRPGYHPYARTYRQGFSLTDTQLPSLLLDRAYQFLKIALRKRRKICFIGHPPQKRMAWSRLLVKHRITHISSDDWTHGLLMHGNKTAPDRLMFQKQSSIVVIFDLKKHDAAKEEALRMQKIIVGFGSSPKEMEKIDYPIPLPLSTAEGGKFYYSFLCNLFRGLSRSKKL